jgi:hypothetical protein
MKKAILLCLLIFLAALSGCLGFGSKSTPATSPMGLGQTKGAEITEFSSIPYIDEGEPLDVSIYVQNFGDTVASNVMATLYQKSGFYEDRDKTIIEGGDLLPPDKEFDIPGDVYSKSWQLTAPSVEADQDRSFLCKVTYGYQSTASSNIQLVGKSEWDSRGGAGAFSTYSTSSEGPVTLKIIEVPAIRISVVNDDGTKTVPIDILFKNTGTGLIENKEVSGFELSVKKGNQLMIFARGDTTNNFIDEYETAGIDCGSYVNNGVVELFGVKQERSMRCYLTLPFDTEADYSGYIVEASIDYKYSVHSDPLTVNVRMQR